MELARVLLVHGDLARRLALQTILQAGGYAVETAATPSEALTKLDERTYDLVLSDPEFACHADSHNVLTYARTRYYRPATALVTSTEGGREARTARRRHRISVYTENLPSLLTAVAELIGLRASRRYRPVGQLL